MPPSYHLNVLVRVTGDKMHFCGCCKLLFFPPHRLFPEVPNGAPGPGRAAVRTMLGGTPPPPTIIDLIPKLNCNFSGLD